MFRKVLVALDGSDEARAAFVFATDWARQFDAQLWFIQLTEESHRPRGEIVTDVSKRGVQRANHFSVSGATKSLRNQQLVTSIAEAAEAFEADMIIVGLDRRRLGRARFRDSVREQLTAATSAPVLIAPKRCAVRIPAEEPQLGPIALGPAPGNPLATQGVLTHV